MPKQIATFENVDSAYKQYLSQYKKRKDSLNDVSRVAVYALRVLNSAAFGTHCQGELKTQNDSVKSYEFRTYKNKISRPIRSDQFIASPAEFEKLWAKMAKTVDPTKNTISHPDLNRLLYTGGTAVGCVYDLLQPESRAIPGIYFEMMLGSLLTQATGIKRKQQVSIPGTKTKIATDFLFETEDGVPNLVVSAKTTSRDRLIHSFVNQLLINATLGEEFSQMIHLGLSELQRDKNTGVVEVCRPHQLDLYQKHVAQIKGMFYADPPASYQNLGIMPVYTLGELFSTHLPKLITGDSDE